MSGFAVVKKKENPSSLTVCRNLKQMGLEKFSFWWFHGSEMLPFTTKFLIKLERQIIIIINLFYVDETVKNFYKKINLHGCSNTRI